MNNSILVTKKKGHYNYDICKSCGGRCCKTLSGAYIPDDFNEEITFDFIKSLIDKGNILIDCWEDEPRIYYLRPRHKDSNIIDMSWGGICIHYNEDNGCNLSEEDRPYQCRMLIPDEGFNCDYEEEGNSKYNTAIKWINYQDILINIIPYSNEI